MKIIKITELIDIMLKRLFASKKRPFIKNRDKMDRLSVDLSGTKLEISMPPHDGEFEERRFGAEFNIFDQSLYDYGECIKEEHSRSNFGTKVIWSRRWRLYGAVWHSRYIGKVTGAAVLTDVSKMSEKLNCFNREQFENIIFHNLHFSYGPGGIGNKHTVPVNWQVKTIAGCDWLYLESWSQSPEMNNETSDHSDFEVCMFAPIDEHRYMKIVFSVLGFALVKDNNMVMLRLIEDITSTMKLTYSPVSAAKKLATESRCPGSQYSASREPENWQYATYREGNILKGEPRQILVEPGGKAPPLKLD